MLDKIKLGDKEVRFYSNVNELPIKRYQLLNKYLLIDSGIGSDTKSILKHFHKLDQFIEVGDIESISLERENMLMCYNFIGSESYIKSYTFASLIKEVDGEKFDVTDDNIDELVELLECSPISVGELNSLVDSQKKSLMSN